MKKYISLAIWVVALILIGSLIGHLTKTEINTWYKTLNLSPLTPPNYIFPIAWTILYIMIATFGWLIYSQKPSPQLAIIKKLFLAQLILNWIWTPLFFTLHLTGASLLCLLAIDSLVIVIIHLSCKQIKLTTLLLIPYLFWIIFATYLNFYVWWSN